MKEELIVHTDGGSIETGGKVLDKGSKFLGNVTNNFAEYSGVILALEAFERLETFKRNPQIKTTFYLDSELVVRQMNGIYKIKNSTIKVLVEKIRKKILANDYQIYFKNIPRNKNKIADLLVNDELDKNT